MYGTVISSLQTKQQEEQTRVKLLDSRTLANFKTVQFTQRPLSLAPSTARNIMSIPRFSNPHSITISIQSVTRSEFFRNENDTALWSCAEGSEHAEELAWLEEHLQGSLSSIENKPQKSKRHPGSSAKQGPEELAIGKCLFLSCDLLLRHVHNVEFRLVSSAPPQPISLEPKPPKSLR